MPPIDPLAASLSGAIPSPVSSSRDEEPNTPAEQNLLPDPGIVVENIRNGLISEIGKLQRSGATSAEIRSHVADSLAAAGVTEPRPGDLFSAKG